MNYGRVDVYWPDKPVESYRLNKATIAVGRSPGNDIVLDTTTISRYHITFTFQEQQVLLTDLESVNGTYVDGVRLRSNEPLLLYGGEEIQTGEVRLIYHPPLGQDAAVSDETTQRLVFSQPSYRIVLEGPDMAVAPGAHVQARLKIENVGEEADRYFIEIDGLPKGWARADRAELPLKPGEHTQVMISFKPLRRSESQPGEHSFTVRVRSKLRPAETIDAKTNLHVLAFSGFGMALGSSRVAEGETFNLYVHNQGNAILPLTIQGMNQSRALLVHIPGGQVQLDPGERRTLIGTVRTRRTRWFGQEQEYEFVISARAHDPSGFLATVPGVYVDQGRLPAWSPLLAIPLVALIVLAVVGLGLLLLGGDGDDETPDEPPVITTFEVSAPVTVLGEQIVVSWAVDEATELTLFTQSMRGQQPYALEPGAMAYTLTFDHTGLYTLTLSAHSGDAISTATAHVEVRPIVTLTLEVLGGAELVRNVEYDVRVRWSVAGAKEYEGGYNVWLEGSHKEGLLFVPPMPLTGEQDVTLTLGGDTTEWLVTLFPEGEDQVLASITQKVAVVYPICELRAEQTVVRSGPGTAYPPELPPQPVGDAAGSTLSYSPLARDLAGEWLQVTIALDSTRLGWVPLADFECTNFDPQRLIIAEDIPDLPAVSPVEDAASPTSTPVVIPTTTP
ncbi:MAG: FHA domain-containing protein [Anaerolineae bacterium]|nr:FHA domain-containing protein [Anaerolineae bacterium]